MYTWAFCFSVLASAGNYKHGQARPARGIFTGIIPVGSFSKARYHSLMMWYSWYRNMLMWLYLLINVPILATFKFVVSNLKVSCCRCHE